VEKITDRHQRLVPDEKIVGNETQKLTHFVAPTFFVKSQSKKVRAAIKTIFLR
jgi:hypothetical protein